MHLISCLIFGRARRRLHAGVGRLLLWRRHARAPHRPAPLTRNHATTTALTPHPFGSASVGCPCPCTAPLWPCPTTILTEPRVPTNSDRTWRRAKQRKQEVQTVLFTLQDALALERAQFLRSTDRVVDYLRRVVEIQRAERPAVRHQRPDRGRAEDLRDLLCHAVGSEAGDRVGGRTNYVD